MKKMRNGVASRMNPYDSPSSIDREPGSAGSSDPRENPDDLHKRQISLIIRLILLSIATVLISIIGRVVIGNGLVPLSMIVALILGLVFTVPWKR
jgi:hypothetical protein